MTESSNSTPHIRDKHAPLQDLISQALVRFGDYSPATTGAQTLLMLMEFANQVIDEVRSHPYWDGTHIDHYEHHTEWRAVPDTILRTGILYYYALQQGSQKAGNYGQDFIRTMNRELWYVKNGNTRVQLHVVDGGSNPKMAPATNETNGLPE